MLKDLSHDQRLLYENSIGISTGTIDKVYASRKLEPLNHALWLTLSIRVMCVYTITEKLSKKLKDILTFIVKCCSLTWVLIKQATSLSEAPEIIYKFLTYLKDVDNPDNTAIVHRNLKSNTFTLLTDNFL